ncbi:MAG: 3-dehydroquinate synthase [Brevinematia bacterium]
MIELKVNIIRNEDLSYPIFIGKNVLDFALEKTLERYYPTSITIITDRNVANLHLKTLLSSLAKTNIKVHNIIIKPGENQKNRKTKEFIEDTMLINKVDRKGLIIAFGGGVIGDIAGFVAATYMRGINFIQVPTTLLATVDSSIGGKVAIDTPYGKNTIGAFYQPKSVITELSFLETLPEIQFKNGLVETIKHSIIKDKNYFYFILNNKSKILSKDPKTLEELIKTSCEIKKSVVESDEKETGLRQILNFGHTVGHAIELISNYKILHGFAVSVGMVVESIISKNLNILPEEDLEEVVRILREFNLPTSPKHLKIPISTKLVELMKLDKKSIKSEIMISLPKEIGRMIETNVIPVEPSIILSSLEEANNL